MAEKKKISGKTVYLRYAVCLVFILAGLFTVLPVKPVPVQIPYISKAAQDDSDTEEALLEEAALTVEEDSLEQSEEILYQYREGFYYQKISKDIKKRMMGKSYKKNPDIKLSDLRYLRVLHYNFKGNVKSGELVVNKSIAKKTLKLFYELYEIQYPIQRMKLIDDYDADDVTSMEHNNTSCFCYRKVDGKTTLSKHALGKAIDINPRINPYVYGNYISPSNGKSYRERKVKKCKGRYRKYMIHKGDAAYCIFMKYGFTTWGGNWNYEKDYQHFQAE